MLTMVERVLFLRLFSLSKIFDRDLRNDGFSAVDVKFGTFSMWQCLVRSCGD